MAKILGISPSNDEKILYEAFVEQFGKIFSQDGLERYILGNELLKRVEKMKNDQGYKGVYVIESIQDYIQILKQVRTREENQELWFRGQMDAKYRLVPNIIRQAKQVADLYGRGYQPRDISWGGGGHKVIYPNINVMLREFKERVKEEVKFEIANDFEWLYLAQHYGMLTPRLDWSEDPLVALFFAVDEVEGEDSEKITEQRQEYQEFARISEAASIYIINPGKFNENTPFTIRGADGNIKAINYPIEINEGNFSIFEGYLHNKYFLPICIKASKREYRICRQSGNFLFQGSNVEPIDSAHLAKEFLYKIYIPYGAINKIKEDLVTLNICKKSIYGEETSIDVHAQEIRGKGIDKFREIIEELNDKYTKHIN